MEGHLQVPAEPTETIAEAQESIVESFQFFDDWSERYQYLIELGRQLPPFPETAQVEGNRIHGCQSGVWLVCDYRNGRLEFAATSDSAIVAGIIALLLQVYSGRRPQRSCPMPTFVDRSALTHLSAPGERSCAYVERIVRSRQHMHRKISPRMT